MNIKDFKAEVIKEAGERCQVCRAAQDSFGYFIYEKGKKRFKAFCRTDRSLVSEIVADMKSESVLTTISLDVACINKWGDKFDQGDIIAICQECRKEVSR